MCLKCTLFQERYWKEKLQIWYPTFCFALLHLVRALFSALGTVCLHVFVRHGLYIVRRYDKTILISIVRNKSWVLGFQVIGGYTFIWPFQVYRVYIDLCTFIVGDFKWNLHIWIYFNIHKDSITKFVFKIQELNIIQMR